MSPKRKASPGSRALRLKGLAVIVHPRSMSRATFARFASIPLLGAVLAVGSVAFLPATAHAAVTDVRTLLPVVDGAPVVPVSLALAADRVVGVDESLSSVPGATWSRPVSSTGFGSRTTFTGRYTGVAARPAAPCSWVWMASPRPPTVASCRPPSTSDTAPTPRSAARTWRAYSLATQRCSRRTACRPALSTRLHPEHCSVRDSSRWGTRGPGAAARKRSASKMPPVTRSTRRW